MVLHADNVTETERDGLFAAARDAILTALPDVWAIYVYGSFARGEEWPGSDLDIAVLLPPEQGIRDLLQLIAKTSSVVGRDVDVVDLRQAGDVLRREVLATGRQIYAAEPNRVLGWEASAMSRYTRHREEIQSILEEFHRSGIGYRS